MALAIRARHSWPGVVTRALAHGTGAAAPCTQVAAAEASRHTDAYCRAAERGAADLWAPRPAGDGPFHRRGISGTPAHTHSHSSVERLREGDSTGIFRWSGCRWTSGIFGLQWLLMAVAENHCSLWCTTQEPTGTAVRRFWTEQSAPSSGVGMTGSVCPSSYSVI